MCRFVLYRGAPITLSSLITEPDHSIIHQSHQSREREEPLNGDGFGVAWYAFQESEQPAVFRDVTPAWNNVNLQNVARVVRSGCILAHVRAATAGLPVTQLNCHPFTFENLAFMHNGEVGGFRTIRRQIQAELSDRAYHTIHGSTDSEHVFALFIDRLDRQQRDSDPLKAIAAALAETIGRIEELRILAGCDEPSYLNLAVTDGRRAVVTRFISPGTSDPANTLYVNTGDAYACIDGACRMINPDAGRQAVLVASEPLSLDPGWRSIAPNHMILIHDNLHTQERPIASEAAPHAALSVP